MSVGIGLVGTGLIGRVHVEAVKDSDKAHFVACFHPERKKAEAFANEFGLTPYWDLGKMLADQKVELVDVATPSGAHMEPAVAAARAGKHLFVEKPLEVSLPRCDAIIETCTKAGVVCAGSFQSRFAELSQILRRHIDSGRFGTLAAGSAYLKFYRSQDYFAKSKWHGTWALDGGGAAMNQGIHAIDLLNWLVGPVDEVSAYTATRTHEGIEVDDNAVASIKFSSGAIGVIEASTSYYPGYLKRIELAGSKGSARIVQNQIEEWHFVDETDEDRRDAQRLAKTHTTGEGASDPAKVGRGLHRVQLENVAEAVSSGGDPAISGFEARKAVALVLAIYESARTGRPARVPS